MLSVFEEQYKNLLIELNKICQMDGPAIKRTEKAIDTVQSAIDKVKAFIRHYSFNDAQEEIDYYKNTLPFFQCLAIYYAHIFNIDRNQAADEKREREKCMFRELKKIRLFMGEHRDFVTYYKLGKSFQDILYFTKLYDTEQRWLMLDRYAYGVDQEYCTRYSLLLSTVLAYEKLQKYLWEETMQDATSLEANHILPDDMVWQISVAALGELIIGLYASRVFKNPKIPLATVSRYICKMFGTENINIHKVKEELRMRKKSRTPFFDITRINLLRFWDEEDLHAP